MRHAIVGAGFGATAHLPAFAAVPGVDVIALSDTGSGRAAALALPRLATYSDWRRMLDDARPDTLSVAVPPLAQRAIVEEALARGIDVLCEKPFGASVEEAAGMMRAADAARRVGAVGLQFRFEPGIPALREQVRSGRIGRVRRIDVSWITSGRADASRPWTWQHDAAAGGGVIAAFLPHVVDLLYWLSGSQVTSAAARASILVGQRPCGDGWRTVTAEDMVDAICELEAGIVAAVRVTNCQPCGDGLRIEVHGEHGVLRYAHRPPFAGNVELVCCRSGAAEEAVAPGGAGAAGADSRVAPLRELVTRFVDAVRGASSEGLPTFADGWHAQQALAVIRKAAGSQAAT